MKLAYYIDPVKIESSDFEFLKNSKSLMYNIAKNTEKNPINLSDKFHIAILGVPEDRNSQNTGAASAPDIIRQELYKLYKPAEGLRIVDLGNLKKGNTVNDTYTALKEVAYQILKKNITLIVIGGTQELTVSLFETYSKLKRVTNITDVDSRFDLGENPKDFDSQTFLNKIVNSKSKYLLNLSNIGYQSYYVPQDEIDLMNRMYFDTIRLGQARTDMTELEPVIRDTDLFSIDISSVKSTDAPGNYCPSIHGFLGEEMCMLAKYAGASDRLTTFALFEVNPLFDEKNKTSQLAAQTIWHFIQGYSIRKNEFPDKKAKNFQKYIVKLDTNNNEIIFYKSKLTSRWWLEVPYNYNKEEKIIIIACSVQDYNKAVKNEIPEIWWKYFQKLN